MQSAFSNVKSKSPKLEDSQDCEKSESSLVSDSDVDLMELAALNELHYHNSASKSPKLKDSLDSEKTVLASDSDVDLIELEALNQLHDQSGSCKSHKFEDSQHCNQNNNNNVSLVKEKLVWNLQIQSLKQQVQIQKGCIGKRRRRTVRKQNQKKQLKQLTLTQLSA